MAANLIPISSPHSLFSRPRHYTPTTPTSSSWSHLPSPLINPLTKPYGELRLTPLFSTPSPSSLVEEEEEDNSASPSTSTLAGVPTEDADKLPLRGCKACGREEVERGCNGEGRIQGGIATVPGFGWWPIKAYRPCPGFVESGGRYRRRGQSMDEVAWGRSERPARVAGIDEPQPSKKKKISQKSKG